MDIYDFLRVHDVHYQKFDHPAVFTCEEAERLLPTMPGMHTKNLFLRDKPGKRHILVSVPYEKRVDIRPLGAMLEAKDLSFASPDRLKKYLGVDPGSVTILGLINDSDHAVEVIIDEELWKADAVGCHPLVNTGTLVIPHDSLETFLKATGHVWEVIDVPSRAE